MTGSVLILGCGFTGRRVAAKLAARGYTVLATSRHPERLNLPGVECLRLDMDDPESIAQVATAAPRGVRVLLSLPLLGDGAGGWINPVPRLLEALDGKPARVVYLSTTGVYGAQTEVDEHTLPAPREPREQLRVEAERDVQRGAWSSLILRPAAIYGPGRGVHVSMRRGTFRLPGDGTHYISRVHVDDLAELAAAALLSDGGGAWPVADEAPCTSLEICRYVAELAQLPMPASASPGEVSHTLRNNRRVDGRAAFRLLGVSVRYPSYLIGIPACLAEESAPAPAARPAL